MALREGLELLSGQRLPLGGGMARQRLKVLRSMLGPAFRGFVQQRGKSGVTTAINTANTATFTWSYDRDDLSLERLYEVAKVQQWNATTALNWDLEVQPLDTTAPLLPDRWVPQSSHPLWQTLTEKQRAEQRHAILSWLLSQFLHGEQGALFAAAQVTEAVPWLDAKLYGSSQVADEGRHVEVFHRYLSTKLEKVYVIDNNLYTVIDALMTDRRWDLKFLGMQIMIEGLALGAFGAIRQATSEPLLKDMLKLVIGDEARHVHYGVLALSRCYEEIGERDRAEREDWALEISRMLRDRFLAREVYEEHWAPHMSAREWDKLVLGSDLMGLYRDTLFKRIVPNLKRIGLLTDRVRDGYASLGALVHEGGAAADKWSVEELLQD